MSRPIQAIIHQNALQHNLSVARQYSPHSSVFAVVKANAYGHGIERIYPAFKTADGFALLEINEAKRIRELGWTGKILLLEGVFQEAELMECAELNLQFTVHNEIQVEWLKRTHLDFKFDIFLKLNSGMNRLGFHPQRYHQVWHELKHLNCVASITHMTHFSDADGERLNQSGIDYQIQVFNQTVQPLGGACSVSNSAAILRHSTKLISDVVRSGIMLYGSSPDFPKHQINDWNLRPTMSLRSEIIGIQHIEEHQSIGYGSTFFASKPMKVGIVACGYADGYQRMTKAGTPVLVNGLRTFIIGRVSMDMLTVDLTEVDDVEIGSEVVLWGNSKFGQVLSIDEVASGSGTVGYELMCAVTARVSYVIDD